MHERRPFLPFTICLVDGRKLPVPHPGFFSIGPDEQFAIVAHLSSQTARSKKLEDDLQASIDLLKERRSALITAAVTGQIPVEEMTG